MQDLVLDSPVEWRDGLTDTVDGWVGLR